MSSRSLRGAGRSAALANAQTSCALITAHCVNPAAYTLSAVPAGIGINLFTANGSGWHAVRPKWKVVGSPTGISDFNVQRRFNSDNACPLSNAAKQRTNAFKLRANQVDRTTANVVVNNQNGVGEFIHMLMDIGPRAH